MHWEGFISLMCQEARSTIHALLGRGNSQAPLQRLSIILSVRTTSSKLVGVRSLKVVKTLSEGALPRDLWTFIITKHIVLLVLIIKFFVAIPRLVC
jgi:hypothetical protein